MEIDWIVARLTAVGLYKPDNTVFFSHLRAIVNDSVWSEVGKQGEVKEAGGGQIWGAVCCSPLFLISLSSCKLCESER